MIFERSLQRELAYTAGAVFMVLLTIMLTTMMIRIVGFAASGEIDPRDVVVLIGLTVIGYLAVMLIVTLFVSILFVLTRWYRDSEMVVWLASGVSQTQLIKPIAVFSTPIIILIVFFAFVGWPWSNQQSKLIKQRFQQRDEVSLLAPGQFRESPSSHRVFFIEKMSPDQGHVENVFVTSTEGGKVNVIVSKTGHTETRDDGDRFIVLENGRRYDGEPGQPNFRIMEFERYGVKIQSHQVVNTPTTTGISTPDLLANPTRDNLAEFAWRAGLPLIAINLMLLAIPLSYQNPRRSRTINLVMAVLIYLTYSNLLNVVQSWIEQGKMSFGVGHRRTAYSSSARSSRFIFWLRIRNRPLFKLSSVAVRRGPDAMRIYERYFARQIYLAFVFILFAFSGLFFFFDLINELNTVGHGNYKFALAVLRVALQTPSRFYEIIPVAALISAIYVFAQMAAASEFTIFRVSGLSTGRALRSLLKIGVPIVFVTYIIGEVVGPYTDQLTERVRLEALGSSVSTNFQSGVWVKDTLTARDNGEQVTRFVNVGQLNPDTTIANVRIYEFDSKFRLHERAHREERRV